MGCIFDKATIGGHNHELNAWTELLINPSTAAVYINNTKYQGTSDDRLKFNETYIENAIDTIQKLKLQKYNLSTTLYEKLGNTIESGLIAQEIYYDAPELRHLISIPTDASGIEVPPENYPSSDPSIDPDYSNWGSSPAGVQYTGLIPYLIKAIQEQQTIINDLKYQYQSVVSRLEALENK